MEISANMEMNLTEWDLHLHTFFFLMGFLQALGECRPLAANICVLGLLVVGCLQWKQFYRPAVTMESIQASVPSASPSVTKLLIRLRVLRTLSSENPHQTLD